LDRLRFKAAKQDARDRSHRQSRIAVDLKNAAQRLSNHDHQYFRPVDLSIDQYFIPRTEASLARGCAERRKSLGHSYFCAARQPFCDLGSDTSG
jgi:hypothetical protein